jgi:hypothetical protein
LSGAARAAALLALVAPLAARAQEVVLGVAPRVDATVVGRVCVDLDGDGRCGADEPGVAGARIVAAGGPVATAGPDGRFHLLDLPGRLLARDRSAYGALSLAVEGLGARAALELAPDGVAAVDLAVPLAGAAPAPEDAPSLRPAPEATAPPDPGSPELQLAAQVPPGAVVALGGRALEVDGSGVVRVPLALVAGPRRLDLVIRSPAGAVTMVAWPVFVARRADGTVLVLPGAPERVASFTTAPARGGGLLVAGAIAPGRQVRVGALAPAPTAGGAFAAYVPPGRAAAVAVREDPVRGGDDAAPLTAGLDAALAAAPRGLAVATGVGELEVSALGTPRLLVTGRAAGALRANLGAVLLEAGLDVDDRDRLADLARPREPLVHGHALEPARTFLATGDAGGSDDRNAPRGRIFARVAGPGGGLELGATRASLVSTELGRFDRAIFGASGRGALAVGPLTVEASGFGATARAGAAGIPPPPVAHDELAATGGAIYWLSHPDVVPGSEALRVEWRDPFTGLLVRARALVRGEDYELSWASGRLLLARPLASVGAPAALVTGDPFVAPRVTLVADYQHAGAGPAADDLAGGRAHARAGPLGVAVRGVRADRPGEPYRLVAVEGTLDLALAEVRVEAARSEGLAVSGAGGFARSGDGGLRFGNDAPAGARGDALHAELRGGAGPVRAAAWWRVREAGYSDGEFLERRGAHERGADLRLGDAGPLSLDLRWAERRGTDPRDPGGLTAIDARRVVARGALEIGRVALTAEAVDTALRGPVAGVETAVGARVAVRAAPGLTVDASHHQGLRATGAGVDPTFSAAGATLDGPGGALGVRAGWGPAIGPRLVLSGERRAPDAAVYGALSAEPGAPGAVRSEGSALGARRSAGGVEVFTEEGYGRDALGLRSGRLVGARLGPAAGLEVTVTGERGERLRPGGEPARRSAAAAAAGLARGAVRASLRGEVRDEGEGTAVAAGGAAEWQVTRAAAVTARASWARADVAGREAIDLELALGGALRLARASALATVARLAERRPGEPRRDGVLARAALTLDFRARLSAGLGVGVAAWRSAGARDDRLAGSVRARVRVAGPLDVGAEYARRAPLSGGRLGALDAVRAEVGAAAGPARVAVGYTLVGFGGDGLDAATETGRLYLRVQLGY